MTCIQRTATTQTLRYLMHAMAQRQTGCSLRHRSPRINAAHSDVDVPGRKRPWRSCVPSRSRIASRRKQRRTAVDEQPEATLTIACEQIAATEFRQPRLRPRRIGRSASDGKRTAQRAHTTLRTLLASDSQSRAFPRACISTNQDQTRSPSESRCTQSDRVNRSCALRLAPWFPRALDASSIV